MNGLVSFLFSNTYLHWYCHNVTTTVAYTSVHCRKPLVCTSYGLQQQYQGLQHSDPNTEPSVGVLSLQGCIFLMSPHVIGTQHSYGLDSIPYLLCCFKQSL